MENALIIQENNDASLGNVYTKIKTINYPSATLSSTQS